MNKKRSYINKNRVVDLLSTYLELVNLTKRDSDDLPCYFNVETLNEIMNKLEVQIFDLLNLPRDTTTEDDLGFCRDYYTMKLYNISSNNRPALELLVDEIIDDVKEIELDLLLDEAINNVKGI